MAIFHKLTEYDYMPLILSSPKLNGNITLKNILEKDLTRENHVNLAENQIQLM